MHGPAPLGAQPRLAAGLSLKPQWFDAARDCRAAGVWFEVHPENYMVDGGPRLAWLDAVRARHPVSLHGVAMSLAADVPPDRAHLARFKRLIDRVQPALVSEHLAWSTWDGAYRPDLLPFPRSLEALGRIGANIALAQDVLKRRIAIENPSHYLRLEGHEFSEIDFLAELARRTGCALLLDVNNVYVSARNLGTQPEAYIDAFPAAAIEEIHLAGHTEDPAHGAALLVDSHDMPVAEPVWALYERLIARIGPRPTLVERDDNLPSFDELLAESARARAVLEGSMRHAA